MSIWLAQAVHKLKGLLCGFWPPSCGITMCIWLLIKVYVLYIVVVYTLVL